MAAAVDREFKADSLSDRELAKAALAVAAATRVALYDLAEQLDQLLSGHINPDQ